MSPELRPLANAAAKAKGWTAKRDELVREALASGASLRQVADAAGMAHTAIVRIRDR